MCKDPAFLFYSSDFLTGTCCMTNEQKGAYITLMCLQHQKGHLQEKDMKKICGGLDEDVIEKFVRDDEGRYYNKRLEEEIIRRKNYSESRRLNRQGGQKQEDEKPAGDKKPKQKVDYSADFLEFYALYPRKVAKQQAIKAYTKWRNEGIERDAIIAGLKRYRDYISEQKIETTYIKHPATWLNSRGWEDELSIPVRDKGFY